MFAHAHQSVVSGCCGFALGGLWRAQTGGTGASKPGPPDTSSIKIDGDASVPVNKIAIQAIADLEQYWGEQYPSSTTAIGTDQLAATTPSPDSESTAVRQAERGRGQRVLLLDRGRRGLGRRGTATRTAGEIRRFRHPGGDGARVGPRRAGRSNFTARTVTRSCRPTASRAPGQNTLRTTAYST